MEVSTLPLCVLFYFHMIGKAEETQKDKDQIFDRLARSQILATAEQEC